MMNCDQAKEKMVDLLGYPHGMDGGAGISKHLKQCKRCRNYFSWLQTADDELHIQQRYIAPPKHYFTWERRERLLSSFDSIRDERKIFSLSNVRLTGMAAAALFLLVVGVFALFNRQIRERDDGPSQIAASILRQEKKIRQLAGFPRDRFIANNQLQVRYNLDNITGGNGERYEVVNYEGRFLGNSSGVQIPVHNSVYDEQNNARWW